MSSAVAGADSAQKFMRVLYVDTEVVWRGGQEQLFGLISGLNGRGHDIWLAVHPRSPLAARAETAGVRVVPFVQRSELSVLAFFRILRILRNYSFDVIHFNTPRPIFVGGVAAWLAGVPLKVCSRRVNFPLRSRASAVKYNLLMDKVFTVSSSIQETLVFGGLAPERVQVIYEGIDLDWIDGLLTPALPEAGDGPIVGTVAHLSAEKGHETFLEATAVIGERFPSARFLIVGDGKLKNQLVHLADQLRIAHRVRFLGFRSDSEALMKHFDIFCLPSLSEGLSSAILAAMANRLPVVATKVGGIPELVVDGETGYLVEPGKPRDLGEALSGLLSRPELRAQFGRAGRHRIEKFFTVSRKLDATESAYAQLLEGNPIR